MIAQAGLELVVQTRLGFKITAILLPHKTVLYKTANSLVPIYKRDSASQKRSKKTFRQL